MQDQETPSEIRALQTSFLSLVSHELRAPLQTVNGYLDLALSGMVGALSAEQEQFLKRARTGGIQLTAVVDDLLFLARAEGGLFRPASRPTALAPLLEEALEEVNLLADEGQIAVAISLPRALPTVPGDAQRLSHTLRNLLMEAIARAPEGGAVSVRAETSSASPTTLTLHIAVEPHQPTPTDATTSAARTESDAHRHIEWLNQPVTAQRFRVSRLIAEAHGGTLTVAPAPTTAFTLTLPTQLPPTQ